MNIKRLKFDSELCGWEIGKCTAEESIDKLNEDFIAELKKYDLVYLITKFEKNIRNFLVSIDCILADIKITLSRNLREIKYDNIELTQNDFYNQDDRIRMLELGMDLAETSRFYFDENLKNLGRQIYKEWIKNSINKNFADEIIVCRDDNDRLIGFITVKIKGNNAILDLVKVDQAFAGKGHGKLLMSKFLSYTASKKTNMIIKVHTQLRNLVALQYFQSFGLRVNGYEFVCHLYPNGFKNV